MWYMDTNHNMAIYVGGVAISVDPIGAYVHRMKQTHYIGVCNWCNGLPNIKPSSSKQWYLLNFFSFLLKYRAATVSSNQCQPVGFIIIMLLDRLTYFGLSNQLFSQAHCAWCHINRTQVSKHAAYISGSWKYTPDVKHAKDITFGVHSFILFIYICP